MKYCSRPFNYFYLDHFDGDVCLCPWIDPKEGVVGNILKQDFEEIWHSEKAEILRDTVRDGSFKYCRSVACPHLQNNDLEDILPSEADYVAKEYPETVNMAFDFVCNQSCPTCRCNVFVPDEEYKGKVDVITKKILPVLSKASMITASGHGDPFASPYMMNVLENLHPVNPDLHILLETNGVCFDEAHWKRIEHLSEFNFEIVETTNSYYEPVYNLISRGGSLKRLKKNQLFLSKLRKEGKISHTTNCMVVQEKNYIEIPEFIEQSLDIFGFDEVVLKPVYNWGNLSEEDYWLKDVLNPLHPYNKEYQRIINLPIVKDNPRVYNFGGETMHEPKPMPGTGSKENHRNRVQAEFLKRWIMEDHLSERFGSALEKYNITNVFVYGAAEIGRAIAKCLSSFGVEIKGFIDRYINVCEVDGIPVYRMDAEAAKNASLVIISTIHIADEVREYIRGECKAQIISADEILTECEINP